MTSLKPVWLDLELRKDIDDSLTLLFAIEKKLDIKAISIHDPSINELKLLNGLFKKLNQQIPVFITGNITEYLPEEDIVSCLIPFCDNEVINYSLLNSSDPFLQGQYTVFCGGSLTTLSQLIKINNSIDAVVQGGYASYKIVPEHAVLSKFKKRDKVPTWNLNLDLNASDSVLQSNIPITFVSKNICHSSWTNAEQVRKDTLFYEIFSTYLKDSNSEAKCLHDVLAFMSITDSDLIKFKPVNLYHTDHDIPKWWSELNENSSHKISVDYNQQKFFENLLIM